MGRASPGSRPPYFHLMIQFGEDRDLSEIGSKLDEKLGSSTYFHESRTLGDLTEESLPFDKGFTTKSTVINFVHRVPSRHGSNTDRGDCERWVNGLMASARASLPPDEDRVFAGSLIHKFLQAEGGPHMFVSSWNPLSVRHAVRFAKAIELAFDAAKDSNLLAVDDDFSEILNAGRGEILTRAIQTRDVDLLGRELHRVYGDLVEVMCLDGPAEGDCLLVFQRGLGILAGYHSPIGILTFGYGGQGPRTFSSFLQSAGFRDSDATAFEPWSSVRRDGTKVGGTRQGRVIRWEDGSFSIMPTIRNA